MTPPDVSIVLPMFNEAEVVEASVAEVVELMSGTGRSFEVVCVDDGSTDDTPMLLAAMSTADPRLMPVRFSRNFGKEAALAAGLEVAQGRAVVILDADLQHPPGLIPEMLQRWDEGFEVVDAVKAARGRESWLYKAAARVFNVLMGSAIGDDLRGASDFKLLDRQVVDTLLACPERNRFFRGLVAWAGFRVARVKFEVADRAAGRSKMGAFSLIAYSLRNLVAFSAVPLRLVSWIGFITVLGGSHPGPADPLRLSVRSGRQRLHHGDPADLLALRPDPGERGRSGLLPLPHVRGAEGPPGLRGAQVRW